MFANAVIESLQVRKQQLIAESALNRSTLLLQWNQVKQATTWTKPGLDLLTRMPALLWLVPVAGFFIARLWRTPRRPWSKWGFAWQLASRAWQVLSFFRQRTPPARPC